MSRLVLLTFLLPACGNDFGVSKSSLCEGVLQGNEEFVDQPFDRDGDGFFDGSNPDCANTYAPEFLDCDDGNADVNPSLLEVECDALDNDCDAETLDDGTDYDGDGYTECEDCDDLNAVVRPGALESPCNGVDDDCDVATPDSGVDNDGDGVGVCDDCNDGDAEIAPGRTEAICNNIDDDCDATTADGADVDGDGYTLCDDCNDADPVIHPLATEECDNGIDDNCDGDVDEECAPDDYSDEWFLDDRITYDCAFNSVTLSFGTVDINDANPNISVDGGGTQPGTMTGTFSSSTDWEVENVITGACTEVYRMTGTFTSATEFTATFEAEFIGGGSNCFDCSSQSWSVVGTR